MVFVWCGRAPLLPMPAVRDKEGVVGTVNPLRPQRSATWRLRAEKRRRCDRTCGKRLGHCAIRRDERNNQGIGQRDISPGQLHGRGRHQQQQQ